VRRPNAAGISEACANLDEHAEVVRHCGRSILSLSPNWRYFRSWRYSGHETARVAQPFLTLAV